MKFRRTTDALEIGQFLQDNALIALDTETTGLNPRKDKLLDVVLANEHEAIIFPAALVSELQYHDNEYIMHNAKFDLAVLYYNGVDLRGRVIHDTMLLDHLRDENAPHSLDYIIQERWQDGYKEAFWKKYKTYEEASEEDKLEYAGKDAVYTFRLLPALRDMGPFGLLDRQVRALSSALLSTELRGIAVDLEYTVKLGGQLVEKEQKILEESRRSCEAEIHLLELEYWQREVNKRKLLRNRAKVEMPTFNFFSNKQLQDLLYGKLELKAQTNRDGKPTVDEAALTKLADEHPVVQHILDLRTVSKVRGTYVNGTLERLEGGRIYPSFKVNGTVTGRISSENPNLQNLPREGGVRGMYVPDIGYKLMSHDFTMLEVVIEAHYTQDPNLLRIIHEGVSKHDITAESLGIDRQDAKTLNFAMQYRCSPWKVSKLLKVSMGAATKIHKKYWETYAGADALFRKCAAMIDRGEPIVSMFGRQRRLPSKFDEEWQRDAAYREGYAALIQGTGADMTHRAFILAHSALPAWGAMTLFEVHDEIVFQAPTARCVEASCLVESIMNGVGNSVGLTVPLRCQPGEPQDRWSK